ncbi:MAG: Bug family tripartite tricarboxylate transporter substrate binding protein [Betaproteobacteria bacterium]|jgi:tripartite-type tricarboxylate transporter receptor subunit TctC|nr:tripartite tricarboxylate transporter substrate binding protein [Betaproteobacteria bacterium]
MKIALVPGVIAGAMVAAFAAPAAAQDWKPTKPIRMLVGFAPGGGTDTTARAMGGKLAELLGQQIIIDNRPGASGNIATEITANAAPDGYTILMGTIASLAINPALYKKLAFDPLRDVLPVSQTVDSTNILVVHPSVAVKNVTDLIAMGKAKPLNGGSSGVGGAGHLALELFNLQAGTRIVHVPYKGGGPAMVDLISGNINLIFATAASAVPHIQSGKIRALAVTTAKRSALVPDLPTISESGLKGFDANNWYGVLVPAKTPRPIINRLNREIVAVLNMPDVKKILFASGLDAAPSTPEQFGAYIRSEKDKWEKVIKAAGLYHSN